MFIKSINYPSSKRRTRIMMTGSVSECSLLLSRACRKVMEKEVIILKQKLVALFLVSVMAISVLGVVSMATQKAAAARPITWTGLYISEEAYGKPHSGNVLQPGQEYWLWGVQSNAKRPVPS